MDVGSDYLLYQGRQHDAQEPRPRRTLGITVLSLGVLMVIASAGYYIYATFARSQLDQLETTSALQLPEEAGGSLEDNPFPSYLLPSQAAVSLYPARVLRSQNWTNALWAEDSTIATGTDLLPQYQPVNWSSLPASDTLPAAQHIRIPAINLDAKVEGLQILDLGDYRAYETPSFTVGHIPETANPGSADNGWYFGHLESPIKGEGSVFRKLPQLADIVRTGEKVYITVDSAQASYLYQVTRTWVVHQDDLVITPLPEPTITLVTCVPRLVYDHRLLVEAKLVGVRPAGSI